MTLNMERTNGHGQHAQRAAVAGGAGLVSFKTKRETAFISLDRQACARRRVSRLKRSVWASGHLHKLADNGFRPPVCWFVTLTYDTRGTLGRGAHDWQAQHIRDAIGRYRDWCRQHGYHCRYTWVAELQAKGTVHYHLLAWLPEGATMPQWDRPTRTTRGERSPCWPYGMTNTQKSTAGVGYLMKYLSKLGDLTIFPKGLRLYGIGGLDTQGRAVRSWLNLPEWAKAAGGVGELVRRGTRLVVHSTGEILESIYRVRYVLGCLQVQCIGEPPERFWSGPYSSLNR